MLPTDISPVLLYSRQQSPRDPSLRIAAIIIPIIIVAVVVFSLCGCCSCCQRGQPRYPHQQKWWSQTTATTRDHQLEDSGYSREVNRNNHPRTSGGRDNSTPLQLETLPEYSSVPAPPPAYTPNEPRSQSQLYSRTQSQMNTHVYAPASGEGNTNIVVGETPTTAEEVPSRDLNQAV